MNPANPSDSTQRFSNRANDYAKYRPGYPPALYDFLQQRFALSPRSRVADVGCGTGKFAAPLLERGIPVTGIEPNADMRAACATVFAGKSGFASVDGTAENTHLPAASVELVTAAQAFHWFDPPRAKAEFQRILVPGGSVCLVWNERDESHSPFLRDYAELLKIHAPAYPGHIGDEARVQAFFEPLVCENRTFPNHLDVDCEGLLGSLRSASYVSLEPAAQAALRTACQALFERHRVNGCVRYEFLTKIYCGSVAVS